MMKQMRPSSLYGRAGLRPALIAGLWAAALAGCIEPTERPFLYRVEREPPSYLYGTIHVADARVTALPAAVAQALHACDRYVCEIDAGADVLRAERAALDLPHDQRLRDVLTPELYERARKHFARRGVPLVGLERKKVWVIAVAAPLLDVLGDYLWRQPLDAELWHQARASGKTTQGLETPREQIAIFDRLTPAEQSELLEHVLTRLEQAEQTGARPIETLISVYLRGDEAALLGYLECEAGAAGPLQRRLHDELLPKRNEKFARLILQQFAERPREAVFVAVGVGHLIGEDGLIARLRSAGQKVVRVE